MRSCVVDALHSQSGYWYLIVSPPTSPTTFVITVDCSTGNPIFTGIPLVDIFPDHSIALKDVVERGAVVKVHGEGLIGIAATDNAYAIGIIDKTEVTARIPPDHTIKTIRHCTFIQIPIRKGAPKSSVYEDFQMADNHFICDSYDLTNLFPVKDLSHPDRGFVWNCGWQQPFEALGIPEVCTNVIQGVCVSKDFEENGVKFSIGYIARRSVLNPGTRYAARGLNDLNSPGNEVECELLFFKGNQFWSERWRRGSIPIRWKTTLTSKLSSPKHKVDEDYFNGTVEYFKMLNERFNHVTIRCISLLETEQDHAENEIKEFFRKSINQLYDNGIENVFFSPFDLNQHLHADGSGEAMLDFLSYIAPLGDGDGFTRGTLPFDVQEIQQGLMRFNCADSLDRTNLATFYYAMKFASEWCKENKVALTDTPNADPNQPNLIIKQMIIDFLASAFVDSGNVISRLYTNTPAIKINAIKKFSPSIVVTQSDTNITLQRRMQNVMIDPVRQKLIELWTKPPKLSWRHRLDPEHVYIVPSYDQTQAQFPRDIFTNNQQQFEISAKESLVCLPCPMVIISFMINMFPSNRRLRGVTVSGGPDLDHMEPIMKLMLPAVESTTWLRYRPSNAVRWGLEKIPVKYVRFLSFVFDAEGDRFSIGNMKIEGKSIFSGEPAKVLSRRENGDIQNKESFQQSFEDFVKTPMNLTNVLDLERIRITLSISEQLRNYLALQHGISPWRVDSRSQLIAAPRTGFCAFCKSQIPNDAPSKAFKQAQNLPGLIAIKEDKPKVEKNLSTEDLKESSSASDVTGGLDDQDAKSKGKKLEDGFLVCSKCWDEAEAIAQITSAYEEEYHAVALPLPHFDLTGCSHEVSKNNQAYTNEATAAFLNIESSLLWPSGGSDELIQGELREYEMFIVQQAIILKLVVNTSDPHIEDLLVRDENGMKLELNRVDDSCVEYLFKEQPITQRLKFSFKNCCAEERTIKITRVQACYIIAQFPLEERPQYAPETLETGHHADIPAQYDATSRTETFKLPKKTSLAAMYVEVASNNTTRSPLSFYLAFYNNKTFIETRHFILPEVSHGCKLWYNLAKCPSEANIAKIFYNDRIPILKPHNIKFVTQKH